MTTVQTATGPAKTMVLNMGPQHPSTHGVLRVLLELDGETVVKTDVDIGYLHTGIEKTAEALTYSQTITITDRMDYLAPLSNNLAYCLAVEKLLGLEVPKRAQYIRVLLTELTRIGSHLVWLGTHALDLGAMSVFLYCFREREDLLNIFEMVSGQRMMTSYFRIGGLALEPPTGWMDRIEKVVRTFPSRFDEYEDLLTKNRIWLARTQGVGLLTASDAIALGVSGPSLRGSADAPGIVAPQREKMKIEMEALIYHFKIYTEGFAPPPGEVYQRVESPRGELGCFLASDGSPKPYRMRIRAPSFVNLQALNKMVEGRLIADVIASIGTLDIVLGEIDR